LTYKKGYSDTLTELRIDQRVEGQDKCAKSEKYKQLRTDEKVVRNSIRFGSGHSRNQ
jgi:hypothetical protein